MPKRIDIAAGQRFDRLTTQQEHWKLAGKKVTRCWQCRCDCGNIVHVRPFELVNHRVRSCGCFRRDFQRERMQRKITHGAAKRSLVTPEYKTWSAIKARCYRKSCPEYSYYGKRGIVVCGRWRYSFDNFLDDMGLRPSVQHSIERKDNNGNYEPSNCRWATRHDQVRNRRSNLMFTIGDERLCLKDWATRFGVPYKTVHKRIKSLWTIKEALGLTER